MLDVRISIDPREVDDLKSAIGAATIAASAKAREASDVGMAAMRAGQDDLAATCNEQVDAYTRDLRALTNFYGQIVRAVNVAKKG